MDLDWSYTGSWANNSCCVTVAALYNSVCVNLRKTYLRTCMTSEDSSQPAYSRVDKNLLWAHFRLPGMHNVVMQTMIWSDYAVLVQLTCKKVLVYTLRLHCYSFIFSVTYTVTLKLYRIFRFLNSLYCETLLASASFTRMQIIVSSMLSLALQTHTLFRATDAVMQML